MKEQRLVRKIKQDRMLSAVHIDMQKGEVLALGQKNYGNNKYGVSLYKGYLDIYVLKICKVKSNVGFQSSEICLSLVKCPGNRAPACLYAAARLACGYPPYPAAPRSARGTGKTASPQSAAQPAWAGASDTGAL